MALTSVVTYKVFNGGLDRTIDLATLEIVKSIGSGLHGVVYSVSIEKKSFAMKVFKPCDLATKCPFEREWDAYNLILTKEQYRTDCPVVPAYGWFTLPENFEKRNQRGKLIVLTKNYQADVLIKELIGTPKVHLPLLRDMGSFTPKVSPDQVMNDFSALITLGIWVPDINEENFLDGKIVDLSSAVIIGKDHYILVKQSILVKRLVLGLNKIRVRAREDVEVETLWEAFRTSWNEEANTLAKSLEG